MTEFIKDELLVKISDTRQQMGSAAAQDIKEKIAELLSNKQEINIVFAAAPSQNDVLLSLTEAKDIKWERINAFHMDEYLGLEDNAPQKFGNFLKEHIFDKVNFKSVNYINGSALNPEEEAERYGKLLKSAKIDMVIMGIGENGHIAFNDPDVANFNDGKAAKVVKLDEVCRNQQVNDGCFSDISQVPKNAITLTIPTLCSAPWLFCIVPTKLKAEAVYRTVNGEVSEKCPASILRTCKNAKLYLDKDSAYLL